MKKRFKATLILIALLAWAGPAMANLTLFSDNFDSENGGSGSLDYGSFVNWTVSDGTVDLIGNGYYDLQPGNGLYVDMDGSTNNAGKLTSTSIALSPGTYNLSFDLAGNQRNSSSESVTVEVVLGPLFSQSYSLTQNAPFTTYNATFSVVTGQSANLTFEGAGGDNIGMLLDNVKLTSVVPTPSALLLGLLGVGCVKRLKRRQTV